MRRSSSLSKSPVQTLLAMESRRGWRGSVGAAGGAAATAGRRPQRRPAGTTRGPTLPGLTRSRLRGALPAVAVLQADHVVQLRRGDLQDVAVGEAGHAVDRAGGHVEDVARAHLQAAQLALLAGRARLEQ